MAILVPSHRDDGVIIMQSFLMRVVWLGVCVGGFGEADKRWARH